jgi:hypothetical protein
MICNIHAMAATDASDIHAMATTDVSGSQVSVLWFVGTLRIERNYDGLPMWYSNS